MRTITVQFQYDSAIDEFTITSKSLQYCIAEIYKISGSLKEPDCCLLELDNSGEFEEISYRLDMRSDFYILDLEDLLCIVL